DGITYPIPGNDDAGRAISLYCDLVARAALDGISRSRGEAGVDAGAEEAPAPEVLPEVVPAADAPSERFELLTAPRGAPDDLAKLHGVGPQIVKKLNDAGIFHYWQIAALSPEDATKLDQDLKLGGRLERDDWIAHARILIAA
ncbi:MAG: 30S ribosomal protein S2, partial [Methylovirgula sp.]